MNYQEVAPGCPIITQAYGCTSFAGEWAVPASVCPSGWFHDGLDLAGATCCDTPLLAVGNGVVQAIGQTWAGSGGLGPGAILLRLDDGVYAGYGHGYAEVAVGQRVSKGDRIGRVGTQGFSTGCHLHLTIRTQLGTVPQGCINPLSYDGPGVAARGGFLAMLSDDEQRILFDRVGLLYTQLCDDPVTKIKMNAGDAVVDSHEWDFAIHEAVVPEGGPVRAALDRIERAVSEGK
jgi:murein DD-endopeptidase MepM/ murein hydrolase activator NlpD